LRDKYGLLLFTAFGLLQNKLLAMNILKFQFEHLTDPHAAPCHQFKHQPIPYFCSPEYNLINGFFGKNIPMGFNVWAEKFFNQQIVTWIIEFGVDGFLYEIEKRRNKGETAPFCVGFA